MFTRQHTAEVSSDANHNSFVDILARLARKKSLVAKEVGKKSVQTITKQATQKVLTGCDQLESVVLKKIRFPHRRAPKRTQQVGANVGLSPEVSPKAAALSSSRESDCHSGICTNV